MFIQNFQGVPTRDSLGTLETDDPPGTRTRYPSRDATISTAELNETLSPAACTIAAESMTADQSGVEAHSTAGVPVEAILHGLFSEERRLIERAIKARRANQHVILETIALLSELGCCGTRTRR